MNAVLDNKSLKKTDQNLASNSVNVTWVRCVGSTIRNVLSYEVCKLGI